METTHEMLRVGEKNSRNQNNYERRHQARTMNLEENGARFKKNPSSVLKIRE